MRRKPVSRKKWLIMSSLTAMPISLAWSAKILSSTQSAMTASGLTFAFKKNVGTLGGMGVPPPDSTRYLPS